jgi:GNAT superfamily N-acetyltransferase
LRAPLLLREHGQVQLELVPFAPEHLEAAARLLADRHSRHRAEEPLLGGGDVRPWLDDAWAAAGTSGAAALREGELVGYLFGAVRENDVWGRHVWVERAGHAVREPELVRDLYAAAAPAWLEAGAKLHLALVPWADWALDPWYRLGFAQMHMEAIRAAGAADVEAPPGVTVRRGGPPDLDSHALPQARLIWEHQAGPAAFTGLTPPPQATLRADWAETLAEPGVVFLVAEEDGRPVGHSLLYPADPALGVPEGAVYLATTATVPEARGRGIGLALAAASLRAAREEGAPAVVTSWRIPNLLASRFWPARGFRPAFVRLSRVLEIG